jgi:hypothetical protein
MEKDYFIREPFSCAERNTTDEFSYISKVLTNILIHTDIIPLLLGYLFPKIYTTTEEEEKKIYLSRTLMFNFENWRIKSICSLTDKEHVHNHKDALQCGEIETLTRCQSCGVSIDSYRKCGRCILPLEEQNKFISEVERLYTFLQEICPNYQIEAYSHKFKYVKEINLHHIWVNMVARGIFISNSLLLKDNNIICPICFFSGT